jgi:hypothetical protein
VLEEPLKKKSYLVSVLLASVDSASADQIALLVNTKSKVAGNEARLA